MVDEWLRDRISVANNLRQNCKSRGHEVLLTKGREKERRLKQREHRTVDEMTRNEGRETKRTRWRNAELDGTGWDWIARDYDTVTHIPGCLVARRTVVAPGRVDSQLPRAYTPMAYTYTYVVVRAR